MKAALVGTLETLKGTTVGRIDKEEPHWACSLRALFLMVLVREGLSFMHDASYRMPLPCTYTGMYTSQRMPFFLLFTCRLHNKTTPRVTPVVTWGHGGN